MENENEPKPKPKPILNYHIVKLNSDGTDIYLNDFEDSILTHIFVPQYVKSIIFKPYNYYSKVTFYQDQDQNQGIINLVNSFDLDNLDDIYHYGYIIKNYYSANNTNYIVKSIKDNYVLEKKNTKKQKKKETKRYKKNKKK